MDALPPLDVLPLLDELLAPGRLYPVYQPLVRLTEAELWAAQVVIEGYGFRPGCGRLMINFSATALMDPRLAVERIAALLGEARVDPAEVLIELCERDVVEDLAVLVEPARRLRALGIQLALDDFGSGHSNFSLWQALGPEYIKLDRSLIHGMSQNLRQLAIVRALVQVAVRHRADRRGHRVCRRSRARLRTRHPLRLGLRAGANAAGRWWPPAPRPIPSRWQAVRHSPSAGPNSRAWPSSRSITRRTEPPSRPPVAGAGRRCVGSAGPGSPPAWRRWHADAAHALRGWRRCRAARG